MRPAFRLARRCISAVRAAPRQTRSLTASNIPYEGKSRRNGVKISTCEELHRASGRGDPATVNLNDLAMDAGVMLANQGCGAVTVYSDDEWIGNITDGDLTRVCVCREMDPNFGKAWACVAQPHELAVVDRDTPVDEALEHMWEMQQDHVSIVEDGVVQGILMPVDFALNASGLLPGPEETPAAESNE